MKLAADDFGTFLETVHGNRPFAWQQELADRVCSGQGWPAALDVPTGLGKTAVLDVAVFALALQAELPVAERTARTRTFLVVDRRVIVDQAYDRARRLVKALSGDAEIMVEVSRRLELLAGPGAPPLTAARMRGGVSWASRWLASPRLPALVTGTVDQLGSRLLFRGYGVTQTMRPVDAALCGNDSVLLLDEAHLSQAFLRTVRAVSAYEALAEEPVVPGRALRTVLLSATLPRPTDGSLDDVLRCDPARETSLAARARLDAVKSTALLDVKAKGDLAPVLADLATTASARGASRVGVVCNTVALARAVFERLTPADGVDTALLIGRCREVERDRNAETWVRGRLAATEPRPEEGPVIVVATQTIEVGADLDLDALVIEACPLDALTQRLGRLNRLGRTASAQAVVVHDGSIHAPEAPVYGAATARTWTWFEQQVLAAGGSVPSVTPARAQATVDAAVTIDLGAGGVLADLSSDVRAGLASEPPLAPVVLGPILDLWARTHPAPDPDQEVAPFLHGLVAPRAEIEFCWRAGLTTAEQWEVELSSAPPGSHETVSVSYAEALRVLGRSNHDNPLSDLEGAAPGEDVDDVEDFGEAPGLGAWVLGPDQQAVPLEAVRSLRPGSIVVLPSSAGGHDEWGWTGVLDASTVPDVADLGSSGPLRLRLRREVWGHPAVGLAGWPDADDEDRDNALTSVLEILRDKADPDSVRGQHLLAVLDASSRKRRWSVAGAVVTAPRDGVAVDRDDGTATTPVSSCRSLSSVGLERHLRDVERVGAAIAGSLGLAPRLVRSVALAGLAHDLGKADQRFQLLLHGGNRYRHELAVELLAKSGAPETGWKERRAIQERAGWPLGMRHEAVSAALLADLGTREPAVFDGVDAELVLHLVGTHHGYGRPLQPPVVDDAPITVTVALPGSGIASVPSADAVLDWEQPERFARLCKRYGRWGLALLESVVRLADMSVSEGYDCELGNEAQPAPVVA